MKQNYFCENLRFLRISLNISQKEISNYLNLNPSSYSNYESGRREPSIDLIIKICTLLNIKIDKLLTENLSNDKTFIEYIKKTFLSDTEINKKLKNINENEQSKLISDLKEKKIFYYNLLENDIPRKINQLDSLINYLEMYNNETNEEYADELVPDIIDLNDYKKEIIYREIPDYGYIPAGKLSVTYEDDVEFISIPEHNLCSYKDYYILHISGDSMNKLFDDGEAILVEETSDVFPNDIVVARIDDKATVKKLANTSECINLIPLSTNPNHKIQVIKSEDIVFQGRVCGRLSDYL